MRVGVVCVVATLLVWTLVSTEQQQVESGCPNNCSEHGECHHGQCYCEEGYEGDDCSELFCPQGCNGHGVCIKGVCLCDTGYTGSSCALSADHPLFRAPAVPLGGSMPEGGASGHFAEHPCPRKAGSSQHRAYEDDQPFIFPDEVDFHHQPCGSEPIVVEVPVEEGATPSPSPPVGEEPQRCGTEDRGVLINGICHCPSGFLPPHCDPKPEMLRCPEDCNDHGECVDGVCHCVDCWTGEACAVAKCPHDCYGHGDCVGCKCHCNNGYRGEFCDIPPEEVKKCEVPVQFFCCKRNHHNETHVEEPSLSDLVTALLQTDAGECDCQC